MTSGLWASRLVLFKVQCAGEFAQFIVTVVIVIVVVVVVVVVIVIVLVVVVVNGSSSMCFGSCISVASATDTHPPTRLFQLPLLGMVLHFLVYVTATLDEVTLVDREGSNVSRRCEVELLKEIIE